MFDDQLVTVWSAPNYCYRCGNSASIMMVETDGAGKTKTSFKTYQAAEENETDDKTESIRRVSRNRRKTRNLLIRPSIAGRAIILYLTKAVHNTQMPQNVVHCMSQKQSYNGNSLVTALDQPETCFTPRADD